MADLSPELFEEEAAKQQETFKSAMDSVSETLLATFSELLNKLNDGLNGKSAIDGKKKSLLPSHFAKLKEFIDGFEAMSSFAPATLKAEVAKMQQLMIGVDIDKVRHSDNLRADLIALGPDGTRTIPAREFFAGPYETALRHPELLVEIQVPVGSPASAYVKVDRRAGDWAVGAACATLQIVEGVIAEAGIGLTALGAARFVAAEAEDFLRGGPVDEERFAEAGRIAAANCEPVADQRGPVAYKRHLAGELTVRALRLAASRVA